MTIMPPFLVRQRGFTLIEMIVVIVVTSILATTMVLFIRSPVKNYVDSAARADMVDVADTAMRRMSREIHQALPNSMRSDGSTMLEFIPSTAGGRYLSVEDNDTDPSNPPPLSFTDSTKLQFYVIGTMPSGSNAITASVTNPQYVVVYNLGTGYVGADAYQPSDNRALISGVVGNTISMSSNPFVRSPPNTSPTQRFNVVNQPVMYVCVPSANGSGTLKRYWNYGFNAALQMPSGGSSALLAANVVSCVFDTSNLANVHSGLITLGITLRTPNSSDPDIQLFNQIHVDNTP